MFNPFATAKSMSDMVHLAKEAVKVLVDEGKLIASTFREGMERNNDKITKQIELMNANKNNIDADTKSKDMLTSATYGEEELKKEEERQQRQLLQEEENKQKLEQKKRNLIDETKKNKGSFLGSIFSMGTKGGSRKNRTKKRRKRK